jgi:F-type H+-transporting ATPase subunit delta
MKTIKQLTRDATRLFRLCLVDDSLDETRVRTVVQGILQSKRRGGQVVLSRFVRLVRLDRARHVADIESATLLPADVQTSVLAGLTRVYGPGITTSFSQNPALIGGMRITVGADVYDGSVQAGLAALARRF